MKHFKNPAGPKFGFDYPEFSGWRTEILDNREVRYVPENPVGAIFEYPPFIGIKILEEDPKEDSIIPPNTPRNPRGVRYAAVRLHPAPDERPALWFYPEEKSGGRNRAEYIVEVSIRPEEEYPQFSGKIIWDAVLNSFSF